MEEEPRRAHEDSKDAEFPELEDYKKTIQEVNIQLGIQVAAWLRKRGKVIHTPDKLRKVALQLSLLLNSNLLTLYNS
jgi:hypothetical protein